MSIEVGSMAYDFTCSAVSASGEIVDQFNLFKEIEGRHALLFFYPLDFTFVCPTEMIALNKRMETFAKLNTKVITVSVDSQFTPLRWRQTDINDGGIGPVQYTMAADVSHEICKAYGVEHAKEAVAYRASIIIDKNKTVRIKHVNDLPVGRNIDELVRSVQALQYVEKHGQVCQAGWQEGADGFQANQKGISEFLTEKAGAL